MNVNFIGDPETEGMVNSDWKGDNGQDRRKIDDRFDKIGFTQSQNANGNLYQDNSTNSKKPAYSQLVGIKKTEEHFNLLHRVIENNQNVDWNIILKPRKKLSGHHGRTIHFAWGPGVAVTQLVSVDDLGQIIHWNARKAKQLTSFDLNMPLYWVDIDPEYGHFAIVGAENGRIYICTLNQDNHKAPKMQTNSNEIFIIDAHQTPCTVAKFMNSVFVVSGSAEGVVSIWDIKEKNHFVSKHVFHNGGITSIGVSDEDPNLLLTSAADKNVKIWDIRVKNPVQREFESHIGPVHDVEFIPGMITSFGSCGEDGSIRLYDIRMDKEFACLIDRSYHEPINSITFSPSGRIVLAATDHRTLKGWDTLLDADPFQYFEYGFMNALQWAKLSKDGFTVGVLGKDGVLGIAF